MTKPRTRDHIYFTAVKINISITTISVVCSSDPIFGGGDAIQPSPSEYVGGSARNVWESPAMNHT